MWRGRPIPMWSTGSPIRSAPSWRASPPASSATRSSSRPSTAPAIDTVAEATGAKLVLRQRGSSAWSTGAKAARREWVLCLEAGDVPAEGWIRILDRFIGTARPDVTLARLRRPHTGLPARLAARGEGVIGVGAPRPGDLVRRDRLLAGPRFARRVKVRRLTARLERS